MKLNHLLTILSIIILLATLPVKSQTNNTFTFEEENPTENPNSPHIYNTFYYEDNTMVLQLYRFNDSTESGGYCVDSFLSYRIIYPNGTVIPIDIPMDELDIQYLNFCPVVDPIGFIFPLKLYAVKNNFLLLTYAKAENESDYTTY